MNLLDNMKLSTKTAVIISAMLIVIFNVIIGFTMKNNGEAIWVGVEEELKSISKCNALQVQRIMDVTQSTAYNMNNYIKKKYTKADQNPAYEYKATNRSMIYRKTISNMNYEIEDYITENARNAAVSSPDIVGVAVMFEPYKFDKNIENYAFYCSEKDQDDAIKPFGEYSFYSKQEYYAKARTQREMVFTKPYLYNGINMVTAATPIIYKGDLKGVIMSDFDVLNLSRLDSKNNRYPSLVATIYDQDGVLIYDSKDLGCIGKNMASFLPEKTWKTVTEEMKKGEAFSTQIADKNGQMKIGFFYPIVAGSSHWWSLVEVKSSDIDKKIYGTLLGLLTISIVALILIVVVISIVLKKMLNPLQSVMKAAKEIANGNFNIDIPISSKDEIGQLSSSFLEMAGNIKSVQHQLILKNEQLEETIEKLNKSDAANSAKNMFIGNISHEFRTPITLILSVIQLFELNLKRQLVEDEKLNKYLQIMRQNCYRLLRIVNNLIDVSRAEAGFNQLNIKKVDIVKLVSDIVLSITEYAHGKNISVYFSTELKSKKMRIDPDKMERILLNLLSNSIKFTPEEGKIFTRVTKEENNIIISVKDTGIGIPKDKIDLIFDRFHQVDTTHSRMNEGSGIGLSLVKAFTELQGGSVYVKSEIGKGSEFIIKLPCDKFESEHEQQPKEGLEETNKPIDKLDIEFSDIYYPKAQ